MIVTAPEYLYLEKQPLPPASPSLFPWIYCHWTIDHLLLFLQANMSWWWVSSRPSPRSQSSVQWRWQTSPSAAHFTDWCGRWRWRTCSRCWPECRAVGGNAALLVTERPASVVCKPAGYSVSEWLTRKTTSQDWTADSPRCRAADWEVLCQMSYNDWHEKTVFTLCVRCLSYRNYFPLGIFSNEFSFQSGV